VNLLSTKERLMAGEWDEEVKAWREFEEAGAEEEKLWKIMDNLLGAGEVPGVAERYILENYATAMDLAINRTKIAWHRWKKRAREALAKTS
jgi:hypothetical protein